MTTTRTQIRAAIAEALRTAPDITGAVRVGRPVPEAVSPGTPSVFVFSVAETVQAESLDCAGDVVTERRYDMRIAAIATGDAAESDIDAVLFAAERAISRIVLPADVSDYSLRPAAIAWSFPEDATGQIVGAEMTVTALYHCTRAGGVPA